MGCALSSGPSMDSPSRRMEKMKLDNGYVARRPYREKPRGQETRNGGINGRRASFEGKVDVRKGTSMVGVGGGRKSVGSYNGGGRVDIAEVAIANKVEEVDHELVDGWPKWLTDNIPTEVLKDIVPKTAQSYVKIDKIGQGTYSNVYKARDKRSGKIVALKKVRFDTSEPESVKFMAREIMILQKLDHPNIVKLQGLATSRMHCSLYLVFDYMQSDLSRVLSRPDEGLSEPQIKCYMQQLLSGLEHCHERGILHRDIKGSNLLIDRNGTLKIADFGLSNFFDPQKLCPLTTRVVTLWYRAPELLLGSTLYGVGIDLWSVGCLMAEMFAGRPILPGRTEVEQVHRIFKLCGTPADDFYKRMKLSTALKPPQTYKPSLREAFNNFPSSSLPLLHILLALDPSHRGSATSALQNEFFHTSPLACNISGLPVIHVEGDDEEDEVPIIDKRKHRASRSRRRSQSQKERLRKKKEDLEASKDPTLIFVKAKTTREPRSSPCLFPSPVLAIHEMSSRTEAHPNANKNIKNQPSLPAAKIRTNKYYTDWDGLNRLDLMKRSASSREFRSLKNNGLLLED